MTRLRVEERRGRAILLTKNLDPGRAVYGEELVTREGDEFRV
jgi:fibrillarin-like rRNA methylase